MWRRKGVIERTGKVEVVLLREKHHQEPSSPMSSRIPTPSRSSALKCCSMEQSQRTSARRLTFAQPIESTSDLAEPLVVEQEFSLARPSTKDFPQEPHARNRTACTSLPSVINFERSIFPSFNHRSS